MGSHREAVTESRLYEAPVDRATTDRATTHAPGVTAAAVRAFAKTLGFDSIGFARGDLPLEADFEHYRDFIGAGYQGEMAWLAKYGDVRRRVDTPNILENAKTVICIAERYQRSKSEEAADSPLAKRIARYARGRNYHGFLKKKLRKLAAFVESTAGCGTKTRVLCDDAPILERAWAARAGLGFVGKNGMLIVPGQGSFVLLGEIVTTVSIEADLPMRERCGACTRCLDACPTSAFPEPFVLDARKCISYLTIEHRGEIAEPLRTQIGDHLFGCDDCQTVCPFNASSRPREIASTIEPYRPLPRWENTTIEALTNLTESAWDELSQGSSLRRATHAGLVRNAKIVADNTGIGYDRTTGESKLRT